MSSRIFGAAALLAGLAQAANVYVYNNCNFDVTYNPSQGGTDSPEQCLKPGQTYSEPAAGEAHCLKLYGPGATKPTQLEWSTWEPSPGNTILSYDLSDIDMGQDTTFLQHGMNLTSDDPTCDSPSSTCRPAICKPQGAGQTTACEDAYNQPYDVRTLGASASYDIHMHLCTANSQTDAPSSEAPSDSDSNSEQSAPASSAPAYSAPAPISYEAVQPQTTMATSVSAPPPQAYTTAAPQQPEAYGNPNVITQWVENTQVITQVVTARNAEPTMEKRYVHPHAPAHGHHARHEA